jgi:beta-galactosidase
MNLNRGRFVHWCSVCSLALGLNVGQTPAASADELKSPRERLLLDFGWRFHLGNDWGTGEDLAKAGSSSGPARPGFSDSDWRLLNLPHDWVIELPFARLQTGGAWFPAKQRGLVSSRF